MTPLLAPLDGTRSAVTTPIATFPYGDFDPAELAVRARRQAVTVRVLIPARDEQATIGDIVRTIRRELVEEVPLVDELYVIDDASVDGTFGEALANGAEVLSGPGLGKGEAMASAVRQLGPALDSSGALVVFLDGDVVEFGSRFVYGLLGPLLHDESVDLVKGCYTRPIGGHRSGGGRVTELVAKPLLARCYPSLAGLGQPLAGETAMRGPLLRSLELASGYAVEIAMLIDAYELRGPTAIAQVDLGERRHRNRALAELVPQAHAVLEAVLERQAGRA
ncbi:MAG: glycosyltransferase family protein [Acidimicrobiales bacterium]